MSSNSASPSDVPDPRSPVRDTSRQLTLRGMLVATALFGALLGATLRLEAPALFVNCLLAGVAALAWKLFRPIAIGTVLGTLGAQAAVLSGFAYARGDGGHFQDAMIGLLIFIAAALFVLAFFIFFVQGEPRRTVARPNSIAAVICVIAPISGFLVAPLLLQGFRDARIAAQNARVAARNAENSRRLLALVTDVTALCQRLGDAPTDEYELVRLLGGPIPSIECEGHSSTVKYYRLAPGRFALCYYYDWDIYTFDSGNVTAGWVRTPF